MFGRSRKDYEEIQNQWRRLDWENVDPKVFKVALSQGIDNLNRIDNRKTQYRLYIIRILQLLTGLAVFASSLILKKEVLPAVISVDQVIVFLVLMLILISYAYSRLSNTAGAGDLTTNAIEFVTGNHEQQGKAEEYALYLACKRVDLNIEGNLTVNRKLVRAIGNIEAVLFFITVIYTIMIIWAQNQ